MTTTRMQRPTRRRVEPQQQQHSCSRMIWCYRLPLLLILLSASLPGVLAQTSRILSAHAEWPDFGRPQTVMALLCLIVLPPIYFALAYLLWKRRNHFPIAGRGSGYLMGLTGIFIVNLLSYSTMGLIFPYGMSCPVQVFLLFFLQIPTGIVYVVRGWTLIFRVEIMGFLEETRWREEKCSLLAAHKQAVAEVAAEEEEAARYENGGAALNRAETEQSPGAALTQTDTFIKIQAAEVEDFTPVQGEWFIHHRRWIEPSFLGPFVAVFCVAAIFALVIVAAFDPDVKWTNDNFRRTGVLADSDPDTPSQFHTDTWLTSPACLTYSMKGYAFEILLGAILIPALMWCGWRLTLDKRRAAARRKDQEEVHRLVYGTELEQRSLTKVGKYELDDAMNVKQEFLVVCGFSILASILWYLLQYFAPEWQYLMFVVIYHCIVTRTLVRPLFLSFAISRQHRKMLTAGGKARGPMDRLPHHRPLYTLKYILRTSRSYEVLLAFLQKEYSSENALFYKEARSFERASKALEAQIPNWPSAMDPDDEEMTDGTIQRVHSSIAARRNQTFAGPTVAIAISPVPHNESKNGRGMLGRMVSLHPSHRPSPSQLAVQTHGLRNQPSSIDLGSPISVVRPSITEQRPASGDSPPLTQQTGTSSPSMEPHARSNEGDPTVQLLQAARVDGDPSAPKVITPVWDARAFVFSNGSPMMQASPSRPSVNLPRAALDYAAPPISVPVDYAALHTEAGRLKAWAIRISELYLIRAAQYEVNIAEDLSKLVLSQIRQLADWNPTPSPSAEKNGLDQTTTTTQYPVPPPFPLSTLYKATCIAVFQLIERDSFRRFILTPGFEGLLAKADEDELARVERQADLKDDVKNQVDAAIKAMTATPQQVDKRAAGAMLSRLALISVSPKDASRMRRGGGGGGGGGGGEDPQGSPRDGAPEDGGCSTTGEYLPGTVPSSTLRRTTSTGQANESTTNNSGGDRERSNMVRSPSTAVHG